MKLTLTTLFSFSLIFSAAAEDVARRTLNNGNLIIEDIPEIP